MNIRKGIICHLICMLILIVQNGFAVCLMCVQYCFEKWVDNCQRSIIATKYIHIEKENSFFVNFNYTDVLEM